MNASLPQNDDLKTMPMADAMTMVVGRAQQDELRKQQLERRRADYNGKPVGGYENASHNLNNTKARTDNLSH